MKFYRLKSNLLGTKFYIQRAAIIDLTFQARLLIVRPTRKGVNELSGFRCA